MQAASHYYLVITGIILQIILIIPIFLFIWRFIIRKYLHPNPINKYKRTNAYAIVTGASEGVGKAYAERLAKEGFNLILIARRKELLEKIKNHLESEYKIDVIILNYDLCKMTEEQWNEIDNLMKEKEVTALFNNAGVLYRGYYDQIDVENVSNSVKLNIEASLKMTHLFIPHTKEDKKYLIVFMSSMTGESVSSGVSVYGATKAFIKQFGKSISYEYKHIDCTVITPWYIATEMVNQTTPSFGVVSPSKLVECIFQHVGLTNCIDPYFIHYFEDWGYKTMSDRLKGKSSLVEWLGVEGAKRKTHKLNLIQFSSNILVLSF